MGSKVSVVEMTDGLLPGCDRDLVSVLKRRLDKKFEEILLKTKVVELKEQKNGVAVTLEDKKGVQSKRRFDKVLISIGRRPNTENLGLENTAVKVTQKGFVEVDGQQRTAEPHIFAIGDIAGEPMLAHKAYGEANVAAEAAVGRKAVFDPPGNSGGSLYRSGDRLVRADRNSGPGTADQNHHRQDALARQRSDPDPGTGRRHDQVDRG